MFDIINKFIFQVSLIVFMIIAITLFLVLDNNTNELLDLVEESYVNNNEIIVKSYDEIDKMYSGYEIISKIIYGLEYDIEINSYIFLKGKDYKSIDFSLINEEGFYSLSLEIDSNGKIIKEKYKEQ